MLTSIIDTRKAQMHSHTAHRRVRGHACSPCIAINAPRSTAAAADGAGTEGDEGGIRPAAADTDEGTKGEEG